MHRSRARRAGSAGSVEQEVPLSEHAGSSARTAPSRVDVAAGPGDAVLLFVGGPLDGRVEVRAARHGEPLLTITHVHLHGGPKVVHRYDLESLTDGIGVYRVRPAVRSA